MGARLPQGYGRVRWHGQDTRTHRLAWELAHGPIPSGLWVLHHCDNPPCCNPAHLFLGTAQDNHDDMHRKGRARFACGEERSKAKLTEADVVAILNRLNAGEMCRVIAPDYGVTQELVSRIKRGLAWRHIERPVGFSPPRRASIIL